MLTAYLHKIFRPKGKYSFLSQLMDGADVLDIGAGFTPTRMPKMKINYFPYDIIDHYKNSNYTPENYNIYSDVDKFWQQIGKLQSKFDAVVSSHNLEHVDDRWGALECTANAVKPGGMLYLSFPAARSVLFPRVSDFTFNYFDDPTHIGCPPDLGRVLVELKNYGFEIEFLDEAYRPTLARMFGVLLTWAGVLRKNSKKLNYFRLALYGFEVVIIARRAEANLAERK